MAIKSTAKKPATPPTKAPRQQSKNVSNSGLLVMFGFYICYYKQ